MAQQISFLVSRARLHPLQLHQLTSDDHLPLAWILMADAIKDPCAAILDAKFRGLHRDGHELVLVSMLISPSYLEDTISHLDVFPAKPVECVTLGPIPSKFPARMLEKLLRTRCQSALVCEYEVGVASSAVVAVEPDQVPQLLSFKTLVPNTRLRFRRLNLATHRMDETILPTHVHESKRANPDVIMQVKSQETPPSPNAVVETRPIVTQKQTEANPTVKPQVQPPTKTTANRKAKPPPPQKHGHLSSTSPTKPQQPSPSYEHKPSNIPAPAKLNLSEMLAQLPPANVDLSGMLAQLNAHNALLQQHLAQFSRQMASENIRPSGPDLSWSQMKSLESNILNLPT